MPDVDLPFSRSEYAERLLGTRQAMDRAGVEVLFACDPSNIAWLTGYDGWSFCVHPGVLIGPGARRAVGRARRRGPGRDRPLELEQVHVGVEAHRHIRTALTGAVLHGDV